MRDLVAAVFSVTRSRSLRRVPHERVTSLAGSKTIKYRPAARYVACYGQRQAFMVSRP